MNHHRGMSVARLAQFVTVAAAAAGLFYLVAPRSEAVAGHVREVSRRSPMPEFSLPAVGGGEWKLTDHRGRIVVLNFWATWCGPCRMETPELVSLATNYRSRGVEVVGVTLDDHTDAVPDFVRRFRIPYPILLPNESLPLASAIDSLPTTLLIDKQGRVAKTYQGAVTEDVLAADIELLLGE